MMKRLMQLERLEANSNKRRQVFQGNFPLGTIGAWAGYTSQMMESSENQSPDKFDHFCRDFQQWPPQMFVFRTSMVNHHV